MRYQCKHYIFCLVSFVLLVACGQNNATHNIETSQRELLKPSALNDAPQSEGSVLAQTTIVDETNAKTAHQTTSDCEGGQGLGVKVETVLEDKHHLFDKNGNPCEASETLFDGQLKIYNRSADPSINITFHDKYGLRPERLEDTPSQTIEDLINLNEMEIETPEAMASSPYGHAEQTVQRQKEAKPLSDVINRWKQSEQPEQENITYEAEQLLAGVRDLSRKNTDGVIKEHEDKITALMVELRQAEKLIEYQKEQQERLRAQLEKERLQLVAENKMRQQEKRTLENELSEKDQRLREYEMITSDLKQKHAETKRAQEQNLVRLRKDLAKAEQGASETRQQLILEAAKKIAEAEAIASATRLDKREAMEREANRLSENAATIMRHAMKIDAGEKIVVPAFNNLKQFEVPAEQYKKKITMLEQRLAALETPKLVQTDVSTGPNRPMEKAIVILKAEDETLDDIFKAVFAQMADRVGDWTVEWKLSKPFASIPQDKWTVVAEAQFDEFLAYVQQKVAQAHGTTLTFKRFDNNKLFVISDTDYSTK